MDPGPSGGAGRGWRGSSGGSKRSSTERKDLDGAERSGLVTSRSCITTYTIQRDPSHFRSTQDWWSPCPAVLEDSHSVCPHKLKPFYLKDLIDVGQSLKVVNVYMCTSEISETRTGDPRGRKVSVDTRKTSV